MNMLHISDVYNAGNLHGEITSSSIQHMGNIIYLVCVNRMHIWYGLHKQCLRGTLVDTLYPIQKLGVCLVCIGTDSLLVQPHHVFGHPGIMVLQLATDAAKVTIHVDVSVSGWKEVNLYNKKRLEIIYSIFLYR